MPVFFERLTHASRLYESGIPEMLRTHPVTTNRIADALGRAEQHAYRQYPSALRYYLIREALRVRQFKEPAQAVKHFASGLDDGRHLNQEAHEYGHALALMRDRQFSKAQNILDRLLKSNPGQIEYVLASAELAQQRKQSDKALRSLETYYSLMPENYALSVAYIEALTDAGEYDKARQAGAYTISLRADDPRLYRLQGRIEELAGKQAESHRMLAEAYVAEGQLQPATQQLEIALRLTEKEDFQQLSRLESRLNHLREALKREKEEDKP
jgi:predicted Zn-dependent protease